MLGFVLMRRKALDDQKAEVVALRHSLEEMHVKYLRSQQRYENAKRAWRGFGAGQEADGE